MHTKKIDLCKLIGGICTVLLIVSLIFSPILQVFAEGQEASPSPSASGVSEDLPSPIPSALAEDLPSPSPSVEPLPSPSPSVEENGSDVITPRGKLFGAALFGAAVTTALGNPTVNTGFTDQELVNTLLGEGVTVSNIKITGVRDQIGGFSGAEELLGFDNGLVFSTGYANKVFTGANASDNMSGPSAPELEAINNGLSSYDAITLEFDVVSPTDIIFFQYLFATNEWDQDADYNDNFALFVNGQNQAFLPDTNTQVSVQSVLSYIGEPSGALPTASKDIFVRTKEISNFSFTGRTTLLNCQTTVTPGAVNHIKIVLADTGDSGVDSAVFLKGGSLSFEPDDDSPKFNPSGGGGSATDKTGVVGGSVTFEVDVTGDPAPALQWQISTDGGITWVDVPGATAAQLTLNGITQDQNGNMYRVIAVNTHGTTISEPFTLNVPKVVPPTESIIPPTGDATHVLWYIVALAVAAVLLTGAATKQKQKNN